MTKERLREYRDLHRELKQIEEKVETMESALYSPKIPRMTGMPSAAGNGNSKEDLAAKHIELLDYYRKKQQELYTEQIAIEKAIESLPYRERTLLRLYYIDGLTWEEVCVNINYSWRRVHQIHAAALRMLKDSQKSA
jgi:RNA polymerase sigma factor (sigma-70 family)